MRLSVDEVSTNCVWSENNISSCSTVTALLKIATFVCEAATSIGSLSITDKTVSGTGIALPVGSTSILYSDGTNVNKGLISSGWFTPTGNYTAVAGDQLFVNTSASGINAAATMTLTA